MLPHASRLALLIRAMMRRSQIVYTLALHRYIGPKYILFGYMDPSGLRKVIRVSTDGQNFALSMLRNPYFEEFKVREVLMACLHAQ